MNLKDKVVVITGASKGLGRAIAGVLSAEESVIILSSRSKEELNQVEKEIDGVSFVADVTKESQITDLADFVVNKFGRIDIWINDAGIWMPKASVEETDWNRAHDLMEVNFFGTVYGSKAALIKMRKQGYGLIVNIISTGALDGRAEASAYRASKFAVSGFTKCMRKEIEGTNIKVIGVYPGGMRTNLFDEQKPEDFEQYMDPKSVAQKIVDNLKKENPEEELVIKRN